MSNLFTMLSNARHWLDTRVTKQPLTGEDAWIVSNTGQRMHYDRLLERYLKDTYLHIENIARRGWCETIVRLPKWMVKDSVDDFKRVLRENKYNILYENNTFILISWNNERT